MKKSLLFVTIVLLAVSLLSCSSERKTYFYKDVSGSLYVAKEISNDTIKIEHWWAIVENKWHYEYDAVTVTVNNNDNFQWLNDHSGFTITMKDERNTATKWNSNKTVTFLVNTELENIIFGSETSSEN